MSGMDRLTELQNMLDCCVCGEYRAEAEANERLRKWASDNAAAIARELLAHRRASQAAPVASDGLREALQPFASLIEVSGWSELPDDTSILGQGPDHDRRQVTAGDFKRALAALSASPAPSNGLREALEDARDVMSGLAEHILKADRVNTKGMFADLQRARLSADAALSASPAQEGEPRHD